MLLLSGQSWDPSPLICNNQVVQMWCPTIVMFHNRDKFSPWTQHLKKIYIGHSKFIKIYDATSFMRSKRILKLIWVHRLSIGWLYFGVSSNGLEPLVKPTLGKCSSIHKPAHWKQLSLALIYLQETSGYGDGVSRRGLKYWPARGLPPPSAPPLTTSIRALFIHRSHHS